MAYLSISKKDILSLIKALFQFGKKELVFVGFFALMSVILSIIYVYIGVINTDGLAFYLKIFGPFLVLAAFFLYKKITKCSEFDFFKVGFQLVLIVEIFSFMGFLFLVKFSSHPAIFIFAQFIYKFGSVFTSMFGGIGLTYLFFHKLKAREFFISLLLSIVIAVLSSFTLLYGGFVLPNYFTSTFFSSIISGILLYYSFKYVKKYIKTKNPALFYFTALGVIVFVLKYTTVLMLIPSAVPKVEYVDFTALFIENVQIFLSISLWGVVIYFYEIIAK